MLVEYNILSECWYRPGEETTNSLFMGTTAMFHPNRMNTTDQFKFKIHLKRFQGHIQLSWLDLQLKKMVKT